MRLTASVSGATTFAPTIWRCARPSTNSPPSMALTATATPDVIQDILAQLRMPDAEVVHTGFYRPNLELNVVHTRGDAEKRVLLLERLRKTEGTGIIYSATTRAVDELTAF